MEHDYTVMGATQKTLLHTLIRMLNQDNAQVAQDILINANWQAAERLLIKRKKKDDSQNIILVCLPWNTSTPFVTWAENSENLATFWGHYHSTLTAALEEYETR